MLGIYIYIYIYILEEASPLEKVILVFVYVGIFCYSACGFHPGTHQKTGRNARQFSNSQVPSVAAMYSPRVICGEYFEAHLVSIGVHFGPLGHPV